MGPRAHCTCLDRVDEAPRLQQIRGARRRLGCRHRRANGRAGAAGTAGHSHQHGQRDSPRHRQAGIFRRTRAGESLRRREAHLRAAELRVCERHRLWLPDGVETADALRNRGFTGRLRRLFSRPRRAQLRDDRACLCRRQRRPHTRRRPRQHHADMVDEYGALGGSSLLGKQGLFVLRRQRRRCPDRRERFSRRTLSCSTKLGGTGVPQAHSLQQAPQGRALCRLGTAKTLFRRGSRGLPSAAVVFITREEKVMTQSSATQRGSEPADVQFNTDRTHPGRWTITFNNPPINMFVPATIVELGALMTDLEADPSGKAVGFQSGNPDFFIAHLDVGKAAERPEALGLWRDFVLRLSSTAVVSIAKIRGRTRGIGNEFVLACDMRFVSRQSALFGNPEVGVGLVPGGGALEWLPRLIGRSRALEFLLSGDDFDADIAERYGWVNRTLDDDDLDSFVDALVLRLASFDREVLAAAKAQINRFGTPTATELQSSNDMIFPMLARPSAQARRPKLRGIGYGVRSDFELNFGRYLTGFGRADEDETNTGHAKAAV